MCVRRGGVSLLALKQPDGSFKLWVPLLAAEELQPENELLNTAHDDARHPGFDRALHNLNRTDCLWIGAKAQLRKFVEQCFTCTTSRPIESRLKHGRIMMGDLCARRPLQSAFMDFMGPLHPSDATVADVTLKNCRYVLVFVDRFSRFTYLHPCAAADGATSVAALRNFIQAYGRPRSVRTEGGSHFRNKQLESFLRLASESRSIEFPPSLARPIALRLRASRWLST